MSTSPKAVALIDWNNSGHHLTYLRYYAEAFIKLKVPLLILTSNVKILESELGPFSQVNRSIISVQSIERSPVNKVKPNWRNRLKNWRRIRKSVMKIKSEIARFESTYHLHDTHAHFACLYEREAKALNVLITKLNRPWSGLYIQALSFYTSESPSHSEAVFSLFKDPRLTSLLCLDEIAQPRIERTIKRPVIVAPDFTDNSVDSDSPFEKAIVDSAKGRLVIGLVGYLQPSKGIVPILELVLQNELEDYFIVLAGAVQWAGFSPEEKSLLEQVSQKENVWAHLERIPTEVAYNGIIRACDLLVAAYRDFPHSSNTVTKAATFEKPIIVTEGGLMAKRVNGFQLGLVIDRSESVLLLEAIHQIKAQGFSTPLVKRQAFLALHAPELLCDTLTRLLPHIFQGNAK